MEGVIDVLTADEVPAFPAPQEPILSNEPMFVGQPILAVAAVDGTTAANAIERIRYDFEALPFTVQPLDALYPGGPSARTDGNVANVNYGNTDVENRTWTAGDFAGAAEDELPMGEPTNEWSYGELDTAFEEAALVLDESFVTSTVSHHSMEPRSALAFWENGKCHIHGSSQSQSFLMPELARLIEVPPQDIVFVAEYCGGGFGSKAHAFPSMVIPAHFSRKIGRPVMMRLNRSDEYFLGRARVGFQGRARMAFRADGRMTGLDLFLIQENGPNSGFPNLLGASMGASEMYQPESMRFRGISVFTNTIPREAMRGPGQNEMAAALEPLLDKAARELGLDRLDIRATNAPGEGAAHSYQRVPVTSAHMPDALAMAAEQFDWAERRTLSGQRNGSKVTGVGIGQAVHPAGFSGFDGLVRLTPDGKLHIHTGVGNLGTYSHSGTSRVAAEVLKCDWADCVVVRGDSRKHLPFNIGQFGSNTSNTMSRTNYVAAMDAVAKLKEIAANDLGGSPDDYDIGDHRVFLQSDPNTHLTYAQAAQRAIELGGKFSGHEAPEDINPLTAGAVAGLAGTGLIGVAKDNLPAPGTPVAHVAGFCLVEVDIETGKVEILDYAAAADCGTVIHPMSLATQIKGGAVMGFGMALTERQIYDPQNGLPACVGFHQAKPPSYLDVPAQMKWAAVDIADPVNPMGIKGVGEPPLGAGAASLLCAISDALGGHTFKRTPVTTDMIVNAAAGREQSHGPLQANTA
jgi:CO/xanthine dehydrogenase Mo-binding subunit